jgi:formamidopyrimidine-DNA glycosylase
MIEIPEATVLADQIKTALAGKLIRSVLVNQSPHKLLWFYGKPEKFKAMLIGRTIETAYAVAGFVEVKLDELRLLFGEGINLCHHRDEKTLPKKHQLLIGFAAAGYLSAAVQMYGGLGCFKAGENENPYYLGAGQKPSPVSAGFTRAYFERLISAENLQNKSVKAVLATEQRIPGLGNGVLQDILYNAKIHPKRSLNTLDHKERRYLYESIRATLQEMIKKGGRDTEKDLHGNPGGYRTKASKNTVDTACGICGARFIKQAYMGGSIYFCPGCQALT